MAARMRREYALDGVNIKSYDLKAYRTAIGTVFQDFKIYAASVKENVLLDFAHHESDETVYSALEKSGFAGNLESLPEGIDTALTTEFEETGVNLSMFAAAENKSVLFISHRLSTTRDADRIIMLENGSIIEEGSHSELFGINRKYAEMWFAQSSNY